MKSSATVLMCVCMAFAAGNAAAEDKDTMPKDGMMKKEMTTQECKDHMAMAKKEGVKKDDAMMKKDTMCSTMMKKDGSMMNKDAMGSESKKK